MTLGTILGAMFQVMRRNPLPTLGLALLLNLLGGILAGLLVALALVPVANGASTDADGLVGAIVLSVIGGVVAVLVQLVATSVVQGVVTAAVASGTLGERMRTRGLWRRVRPRVLPLIGWILLLTVASALAIGVLVVLVVVFATGSNEGAAILSAVGVGLLGSLGLLVLFVAFGVKLLFVPPVIVLERRGVFAAIARSWRLTRGYFWRTFGIMALVVVIYSVASWVISVPLNLISSLAAALIGGDTDSDTSTAAGLTTVGVVYGVSLLLGWLVGAIGLVMVSASTALLYIDTRMRREGLDLDLARAAEARAAGVAVPDPYAVPTA